MGQEGGGGKRGLQASRTAARLKAISGSSGWREAATLQPELSQQNVYRR